MIKRTIDISEGPTRLSIENDQLVLTREREVIATIPSEDIGVLLVDHVATTYTQAVFTRLIHHGAMVVICGPDHVPTGMVLGMENNELTGRRIRAQARVKVPVRKRLWKQIVRQKLRLQAHNLPAGHPVRRRILNMITEVKSGDRTNAEGRAAAIYFRALFGDAFRRDPDGLPPNNLLNYGYMTMRAACCRAIVAAGLHPALSLQHSHRNNAFALADDLVEVLRPLVDRAVLDLIRAKADILDRSAKKPLLDLLTREVKVGDQNGPLMVQLHRVAASLVKCFEGQADRLTLPSYVAQPAQSDAGVTNNLIDNLDCAGENDGDAIDR